MAGCGSSLLPAGPLDPASVPVVAIGFEGQADTFPYPGGIVPTLIRASVSDPDGQNIRSWSADAWTLEDLKLDATGYAPPGAVTRFAFSSGNRMLVVPVSTATTTSPGVRVVATPGGGTLLVDDRAAEVWVEISVVFEDKVGGQQVRIDETCGFWLSLDD